MRAVEVIEALVLADNHDDVLDRAGCLRAIRVAPGSALEADPEIPMPSKAMATATKTLR